MLEVILVPAFQVRKDGVLRYFVEIKGLPHAHGNSVGTLVVSNALPLAKAEEVKRDLENVLDEYRRPKRKGGKRKPKTSWERLLLDRHV